MSSSSIKHAFHSYDRLNMKCIRLPGITSTEQKMKWNKDIISKQLMTSTISLSQTKTSKDCWKNCMETIE